jgi:hypothetical protein
VFALNQPKISFSDIKDNLQGPTSKGTARQGPDLVKETTKDLEKEAWLGMTRNGSPGYLEWSRKRGGLGLEKIVVVKGLDPDPDLDLVPDSHLDTERTENAILNKVLTFTFSLKIILKPPTNQISVVAFNVPQLTQPSFLQKKSVSKIESVLRM